ncbi:transmembrane protein (macronuclear) [Tetrahymena thermophila SB210]|uniref:Transmembrane protein n=1 Tax=Tetrahymena thermophila (strain SB210) TaxID=312017 RepID=Q23CN0_TETTS|nr:transmembrane protein [Tetrahymena thermophila SB210]EAR94250.3 transmembrane protein [Tetrahymena thermophila SB210]|eukprot:XP_001014495.3 transmembrane protein [Tetrahymena thermophila SB210]
MIQIESSYANINNFTSTLNNMNIVFQSSQQIAIKDSTFQNNTALEGGALYFQNIQQNIELKNCIFINNIAYANGGAIVFDTIKNIFLDQTTNIKQNTALIGGGIRIKGVEQFVFLNKGQIVQNKAEIYGDNIATYPSQVSIQSFSQQKDSFTFKSNIPLGKVWINNFQSGGSLEFDIFFMDENGKHINFSSNSLKQGVYPKIIQNEIQYWNAHLIVFNSSLVQLVGESSSEILCKQCPQEAEICEFDHFILKQGYWRSSNLSDQIFECTKYQESCNELKSDTQFGCIEGYVGPLCEQCDYSGMIWPNRYSENSSKSNCQKCSATSNQIAFLIISTSIIIVYLFFQLCQTDELGSYFSELVQVYKYFLCQVFDELPSNSVNFDRIN